MYKEESLFKCFKENKFFTKDLQNTFKTLSKNKINFKREYYKYLEENIFLNKGNNFKYFFFYFPLSYNNF